MAVVNLQCKLIPHVPFGHQAKALTPLRMLAPPLLSSNSRHCPHTHTHTHTPAHVQWTATLSITLNRYACRLSCARWGSLDRMEEVVHHRPKLLVACKETEYHKILRSSERVKRWKQQASTAAHAHRCDAPTTWNAHRVWIGYIERGPPG
jgi:hypothetical protein